MRCRVISPMQSRRRNASRPPAAKCDVQLSSARAQNKRRTLRGNHRLSRVKNGQGKRTAVVTSVTSTVFRDRTVMTVQSYLRTLGISKLQTEPSSAPGTEPNRLLHSGRFQTAQEQDLALLTHCFVPAGSLSQFEVL